MDFTSVYAFINNGESSSNSTTSTNAIQDYIIMFEYLDDDGNRCRRYLDFACDIRNMNKNDFYFVYHVWTDIFMKYKLNYHYDEIEIWSDGGPHHFKTRYCQWMWHHLSSCYFNGKYITHNFFASYHGHSLADGHAAQVKQAIKSEYLSSQQSRMAIIKSTSKSIPWGPASSKDIKMIIERKINQTTATAMTDIDRDTELKPKVKSIPDIKQKHCFVYSQNQCKMYDLTHDENPTFFRFSYL